MQTGRSILFMPRLPKEYTIVMGHIMTAQEVKTAYQVDEVCYADEMPERLGKLTADPTLLLLNGTNSDSGKGTRPAAFDGKTNLHYFIRRCAIAYDKYKVSTFQLQTSIKNYSSL